MKTETTIDSAGRMVIPKGLREQYGMKPGETIVLVDGGEGLVIMVQHTHRRFVKEGPITAIDTGAGPAEASIFDVSEVRNEHLESKSHAHRR